jgi:hypothetical protein
VNAEQVDWFDSAATTFGLHVGANAFLVRMTMNELEQKLDPQAVCADSSIDDRQHRAGQGSHTGLAWRVRRQADRRHQPSADANLPQPAAAERGQTWHRRSRRGKPGWSF